MAEIKVDCINETCPIPLVETRKAIRNASPGDVIEITGTHPSSKKGNSYGSKSYGAGVTRCAG